MASAELTSTPPINPFEEALIIAHRAIPESDEQVNIEEGERIRVHLSADVTAYCRARNLLTEDQYITYRVLWQPGPSWGRNIWSPAIYLGDEMLYKFEEAPDVERGLGIPAAEKLREEFLEITSIASPLRRVKDHPTHGRGAGI